MALGNLIPWVSGRNRFPNRMEERFPLDTFQRGMNRFFGDFLENFPTQTLNGEAGAFFPRVNIAENDNDIQVSAEIPGFNKKDINITLSENQLTIKGEKKEESEEKDNNYFQREFAYSSFQRSLALPCEVDSEKVNASFKDGVLNISLQKTAKAKELCRKIEIK